MGELGTLVRESGSEALVKHPPVFDLSTATSQLGQTAALLLIV